MAIHKKMDKTARNAGELDRISNEQRPFSKINFWMMGGCLALVIIGFLLMSGGGSQDASFNPDVFSARRIVVGPLLSFLGFFLMAFAIIWSPKKSIDPDSRKTPDA